RPRVDEHAAAVGWEPEGGLHLLDPRFRDALAREHLDHRPAARRRRGLLQPLHVRVRQPEARPVLLETVAGAEEAGAELRRRTRDRIPLRVLPLVDPPAVLDGRPIAFATHARTVAEETSTDNRT